MKVGILYICTGNYTIFWDDFYHFCEKNFLPKHEKYYFVFTDGKIRQYNNPKVKKIYQPKLGWPFDTLKRYEIFLNAEQELGKMDYLFFCNANIIINKKIGDEILPDISQELTVVPHPHYYQRKDTHNFPYERNPNSLAYISEGEGSIYVQGGFNGGLSSRYLEMCRQLKKNVDIDLNRGIIAVWHDESHFNRYLLDKNVKLLHSGYICPKGYKIPFPTYIYTINKKKYGGHDKLRGESSPPPTVSLMLSTYNRPDALNLCLQSIAKQTILPDEVIIGDDGSTDETRQLIQSFREHFPVPIIHVWQEDNGFRLAMSRNKSVAASHCEYIIEIDGDLILHPDFVSDHIALAQKGYFLKGGRVFMSEKLSRKCCQSGELPKINFFSRGIKRRFNTIRCMSLSNYLASRYQKNKFTALGCNMSFWKEDYIRINGYDEFFEGWGGEDYDFAHRLTNSGQKRLSLKFSGLTYHLWHREPDRKNESKNTQYYRNRKDKANFFSEKGIDQYL